jgi:hypothetical protein
MLRLSSAQPERGSFHHRAQEVGEASDVDQVAEHESAHDHGEQHRRCAPAADQGIEEVAGPERAAGERDCERCDRADAGRLGGREHADIDAAEDHDEQPERRRDPAQRAQTIA